MALCAVANENTPRARLIGKTVIIGRGHPLRDEAESLIERVYAETFDAALDSHFPTLVAMLDEMGRVVSAAGCRRAIDGPLFLEQYLDEPIEGVLSRAAGSPIARRQVAEIGSLASIGIGAAPLFASLAAHLHEEGAAFAVATATSRLRRAFKAFGFGATEIVKADCSKLADRGRNWGGYYEHDPMVVWGRVAAGLRAQPGAQR
ncbi:MAG TPA: thermostable hemolysin [Caulobacterales bacterium]|nr:thermostable hemolysin [Caulobacterales bacterium]